METMIDGKKYRLVEIKEQPKNIWCLHLEIQNIYHLTDFIEVAQTK